MLYLYDKSIAKDLSKSFNPNNMPNSAVTVIDPEIAVSIFAQRGNDDIRFPAVMLTRSDDTPVDRNRLNFTRLHKGVQTVFDKKNNEFYNEKILPVELRYSLTILATNTADRDEIVRELLFKYTSMYFLTINLPYECKRQIRFGVIIDPDKDIQNDSGTSDYFSAGHLYQTIIPLKCEGCVLVTYTPVKLRRSEYEIEPTYLDTSK